VYWHVDRGSVVVHSQTLAASASEVAAMQQRSSQTPHLLPHSPFAQVRAARVETGWSAISSWSGLL